MFTHRFKICRLLGVPIYVDLSWFIIALLITWTMAVGYFPQNYPDQATATYWGMGVAVALGLFVSILAHELGHSSVARAFDVPMRGITLFIFGGVAEMSREPPSPKAEFLVAIAGPLVSVAIAVAGFLVMGLGASQLSVPVFGVISFLATMNAWLVGFNMIPAFPLDGGRVLRSVLWQIKGSLRWATRITATIGSAFGMFLIMLGVLIVISGVPGGFISGMWAFLIGMFLRSAAQMSYQDVLIRRALEGEPVARFMKTDVVTVPPSLTIHELVDEYVYKHHHKLYPVVEDGRLLGCVTTREVQQVPREQWDQRRVEQLIVPCSTDNTIAPDTDAMQALTAMNRQRKSRVMVVEDGELRGVLSLKDLMEFISLRIELEGGNGR